MELYAWTYLVDLRRQLLAAVGGIADASNLLWWDNTTPNSTTRRRLQGILHKAVEQAAAFGVYVVTRHTNCERRSHRKSSDQHGYVWSDPYGLNVEWQDKRFVWDGDQLFQGMRYDVCPCSKNSELVKHHVIDDLIYAADSDLNLCRLIGDILSDVQLAIDEAGDRQPRSGIREYLLRAVLRMNDAIMPMTVDEHIKSILEAQKS